MVLPVEGGGSRTPTVSGGRGLAILGRTVTYMPSSHIETVSQQPKRKKWSLHLKLQERYSQGIKGRLGGLRLRSNRSCLLSIILWAAELRSGGFR